VKTAVEYNSIRIKQNHSNEQGILLSNSVSTILCSLLNFALSVSFFKTNSYYSSVYEYEEFINGLITGRLLYGEGLKLNIFMKLQLFSNINMSAQYSETYKPKESLVNPLNSIITNNLVIQVEINL